MGFSPEQFDFRFSDSDNVEFGRVSDWIAEGKKLIAVYGEAGTGKSTFIRELTAYCKGRQINIQCVAFTGKAAGNIEGRTLHSFFGFEIRPYLPTERIFEHPTAAQLMAQGKELTGTRVLDDGRSVPYFRWTLDMYFRSRLSELENLDVLVVDEVSMVRCDLLDTADIILRKAKGKDQPFGGITVLLVGDKRQLPPVASGSDGAVLADYYNTPFSYLESDVIRRSELREVLLDTVYRQKDPGFIALLRGVRLNGLMPGDIETLNTRLVPSVKFEHLPVEHQIICCTNRRVDHYNHHMLDLIQSDEFIYTAEVSPGFPSSEYPTNPQLRLKLGAKVMFLRNDRAGVYYNGTVGQVRALFDDRVVVEVRGQEVVVTRERWTSTVYEHHKDKRSVDAVGRTEDFVQIPLRLAWAMTTHKAQGQTFDNILCDLSDEFTTEHAYVTLSRCRSLEGITLLSKLERQ